jgi:steroid 5-alpha reductase family enzyme
MELPASISFFVVTETLAANIVHFRICSSSISVIGLLCNALGVSQLARFPTSPYSKEELVDTCLNSPSSRSMDHPET